MLSWLAVVLVILLAPCSIKIAHNATDRQEQDAVCWSQEQFLSVWYIHGIIGYCCLLLAWYQMLLPLPLSQLGFYTAINYLVAVFFPYLRKSSRYRAVCRGLLYRSWSDKLVWSSAVYGAAGLFALLEGQFQFAFIAFATCTGSTLYHLNRETRFFNLDNIFATAMMFMFLWTLYDAFSSDDNLLYLLLGGLGLPVALFLLKYCGMPADIIAADKQPLRQSGSAAGDSCSGTVLLAASSSALTLCCIRDSREEYDLYHTLWHFASGAGPVMAVLYVSRCSDSSGVMHFEQALPYYALLLAVGINLLGNYYGIMPLD